MTDQERRYTVPLRKEFLKVPRYKRTQKSMKALKNFLIKHMKSEDIRIGKHLNLAIWSRGRKNPPTKITIKTIKDKDNVVRAELPEHKFDIPKKEEKKSKVTALKDKVIGKKEKKPKEEKKLDMTLPQNQKKAVKEAKIEKKELKESPKKEEKVTSKETLGKKSPK